MLAKNILVAAACVALLFSCSKEESIPGPVSGTDSIPTGVDGTDIDKNKILGTWTFVNMVASTNATISTGNEKSVTISNYTTINNTGTIIITKDSVNTENFGYEIDSWVFNAFYENNVLVDSFSIPYQFPVESYSSKSKYKWVSKDSLYSESGTTTMGGVTVQSIPAGIKLGWSGDTLLMITKLDSTSRQLINPGEYADKRDVATSITKLIKKK